AQKGDADAQFNLGAMYENGEETEQNYAEAYKYYRLAAEQGNIGAQVNLGLFYSEGYGVEQNYEKAAE
ncbi:hypothetical protein CPT77_03235, partial [Snodgrassella alvi]|uniref:tetratricopeptide repeat protein n=4 Tax=Snodgrassella TaxID=1193515 RepID=UPI000BDBEF42